MSAWIVRLGRHDERALHALVLCRRPRLDRMMRALTHLGDTPVAVGGATLLALGTAPELESAGREAAFALAASHALVQLLKRTITRPRPRLPVGVGSLIAAPDRFSFPSGHAAATLSLTLPVATALPTAPAVPVLCIALLVGLSRCYLGVHYPGDVLAGWTLAVSATLAAPPVLG